MGVCTKERKGVTAEVLMATPCTNSLGGESGGHRLHLMMMFHLRRWRENAKCFGRGKWAGSKWVRIRAFR